MYTLRFVWNVLGPHTNKWIKIASLYNICMIFFVVFKNMLKTDFLFQILNKSEICTQKLGLNHFLKVLC
jgi:hypothetical protein